MRFYADLHLHSYLSRACSKQLVLPEIYRWARLKGITVMGTADFTHPEWIEHIKTHLEDDGGLFRLKNEFGNKIDKEIPPRIGSDKPIRFMLTVEISLIYKEKDKVRKVHVVVITPDISSAEKLNRKLGTIGNIKSDGRPILGLSSRDLLEIVLEVNEENLFIPAHIWTPWFSMFGDKSGFDSIEECFQDLSKYIYAIETGLSSDPLMNWTVKDLDKVTIMSNSDAHSLEKIAREANVFNCELNYKEISDAIKKNDDRFEGTLEFYPQEGKYHHDGHRSCNVNWSPEESKRSSEICPQCHKRLTIGVLNRVHKLASRKSGEKPKDAKPFQYIIPLKEILSEILQKGTGTKTVNEEYFKLLNSYGSELTILLDTQIEDLNKHSHILGEAVNKMRKGKLHITPGYDGVYGEIAIFDETERRLLENKDQMNLI